MNKSKIAIGAGAMVLALGGFFAGKANVKRTAVDVYYKEAGTNCTQFGSSLNFTTAGTGANSVIRTVAGGIPTLYSNPGCSSAITKLHLVP